MAGSTKTEFQASVYAEQGKKEMPRSSTEPLGERSDGSAIIAPGLDQFYEFLYRYGLALVLFASVAFSFWMIWALDFSGG